MCPELTFLAHNLQNLFLAATKTQRKPAGTNPFRRRFDILEVAHDKRHTSEKRAGSGGFHVPRRSEVVDDVSNPTLDDIRTTLF